MKIADYHRAQAEHHAQVHRDPAYVEKAAAWLDPETTDYWRHDRMRRTLIPLLAERSRWLTIGDGRYGADANWLIKNGQSVFASDIQDETLEAAAKAGAIGEFGIANAEELAFDDNSFDWVLCKESYHHMPRAPIAFYEMLRVAKKGIVLIEPIDPEPARWWGHFATAILGMYRPSRHSFEASGNFVYSLSRREVEKMMLGIGLTTYAFQQLSDHYIDGGEMEYGPGPIRSRILKRISRTDWIKRVSGVSSQLGVFVVFKAGTVIPTGLETGFQIVRLPENPYAHADLEASTDARQDDV